MTSEAKSTLAAVVTVAEAAEIIGVGTRRVRQLIDLGELDWRRAEGTFLITRASCLVARAARR